MSIVHLAKATLGVSEISLGARPLGRRGSRAPPPWLRLGSGQERRQEGSLL